MKHLKPLFYCVLAAISVMALGACSNDTATALKAPATSKTSAPAAAHSPNTCKVVSQFVVECTVKAKGPSYVNIDVASDSKLTGSATVYFDVTSEFAQATDVSAPKTAPATLAPASGHVVLKYNIPGSGTSTAWLVFSKPNVNTGVVTWNVTLMS